MFTNNGQNYDPPVEVLVEPSPVVLLQTLSHVGGKLVDAGGLVVGAGEQYNGHVMVAALFL